MNVLTYSCFRHLLDNLLDIIYELEIEFCLCLNVKYDFSARECVNWEKRRVNP